MMTSEEQTTSERERGSDHSPPSLSESEQAAIATEERVLAEVISSLKRQRERALKRLSIESTRARELTSALVNYTRDEDKQLIASDEAVSHGLRDRKTAELAVLDQLLKKPYFARLLLDEDTAQGVKRLEYRMGFAENSECRIIDWRKAPIAKLYYEYKEGEEYSEEILGKERLGTVHQRIQVEIQRGTLTRIAARSGVFERRSGVWTKRTEPLRSRVVGADGDEGSDRHLPQIASLLTPEQFKLVAGSSDAALLIQGIAGSGKTTVALHRLAWMLGAAIEVDGEPLRDTRCIVIVASVPLREYVSRTLPSLGVAGVRTITLREWLGGAIARRYPQRLLPAEQFREGTPLADRIRRPSEGTPLGVERVKRSLALLKALEQRIILLPDTARESCDPFSLLLDVLRMPQDIIAEDESKLIDKAILAKTYEHTARAQEMQWVDYADDALIMRAEQLLTGKLQLPDGQWGLYQHVVADEVQDYSPVDLACVIGSVADARGLTLIGDTNQKLDQSSSFTGWEKLRKHWAFKDSMSTFMNLNLSQRSTLQILKVADYAQNRRGQHASKAVEGRVGRVPIWFKCRDEQSGVKVAIDWLTRGSQKYPGALSAVLCRTGEEARYAFKLLEPTFGALLRLGDERSFSFDEGIVVTGVEQVKGLEFTNVLLWNPHARAYPRDDAHRNILYTAITRAEENLCVVTWAKASEILPPFHSPLFRGFDLTIPDEGEGRADS